MKRIILFLLTNIAVILLVTVVAHVVCAFFGIDLNAFLAANQTSLVPCFLFALLFGFAGSIISLLLSKTMAKRSVGAVTVTGQENPQTAWLVQTVSRLAASAGIKTPEVAIYKGSANAFATGAFRNKALVAVSTDIMEQMTKEELAAVLGHEISHVANGDMVTMGLLQGILNTFVIFLARVVASFVGGSGNNRRSSSGLSLLVYYVLQTVLGFLASAIAMAFSRHREYAADAGSARLLGTPTSMIAALDRLGHLRPGVLPGSLKAFGISGSLASIFASHPPLEKRIAALRSLQNRL